MTRHYFRLCAVLVGALALACGDDPADPADEGPPDLSGTYALESFFSALTGGTTLMPPAVSGTMTLAQSSATGQEATGTFSFEVTLPPAPGGTEPQSLVDQGTYTVRTDGSWEQRGTVLPQGTGTFTLEGSDLTVTVEQPALGASRTVWHRQ